MLLSLKTCSKCKEQKELDQFVNEAKRKDGKYPWCKECLSLHRRARYKKVDRKIWITQKVCSKCKQWKPRDQYQKYTGNNLHYRCIECEAKDQSNKDNGYYECSNCKQTKLISEFYNSKTSKQCISCHKNYHQHPTVKLRSRDSRLKKYYGISLEQYKELLELQDYTCPVCLGSFEIDNYSYPVDHAHNGPHEGKIRAILHDICNRFVMARHSDPEILRRAADLMESPLTEWFVPEEYIKTKKTKKKRKRKS